MANAHDILKLIYELKTAENLRERHQSLGTTSHVKHLEYGKIVIKYGLLHAPVIVWQK